MRNRYLLLLKMQLYNLLGINRILHSHSKKEKQRSMALGGILVIGLMIAYSTIISISLASCLLYKSDAADEYLFV